MSSTADDIHSPPADVHQPSISIRDKNNAEKEESGDQSSSIGNHDKKNVQERQDHNTAALQHSVTVPEIDLPGLGHSDDKVAKGSATGETAGARSRAEAQVSRERNRNKESRDFPPLLTTLNINGRPRFDLVKVRETGRLQIFMVPNKRPELVRSPLRDGRLRMWLVDGDEGRGEESPPYGRQDDWKVD